MFGLLEILVIGAVAFVILVLALAVVVLSQQKPRTSPGVYDPDLERPRPTLDAAALNEVMELIRAGNKIGAIKLYRDRTGVGLANGKRAVEDLERNLSMAGDALPSGGTGMRVIDPTALGEVEGLVRQNKRIEAIKRYRQVTGLGLKEAKDAVDEIKRGL